MYNHNLIEKKWQKFWKDNKVFSFHDSTKQKFYVLDMFPYPSGKGLHVGHPKGYTATDVISRYKRLKGFDVLHPIGWDAFGLPAEQYALETNNHPGEFTQNNIDMFRKQLQMLGFDYDYDKEVNTTDPKYFKWTQWIFIQLYKKGLAEIRNINVNWCEGLGTVLANEEVLINKDGQPVSERGSYPVTKKPMCQWVLKITKYADKLLEGLNEVDWPESLKSLQRNWIGKSVGANIEFKVENSNDNITIFTTRPDTIFGVSYIVLAPESKLIEKITTKKQQINVAKYVKATINKSERDRTNVKTKSGVFTGSYAINPINNEKIEIWVGDYVLNDFGTGAVMAVPAHDERDYEFAKKYHINFKWVIETQDKTKANIADGKHINSDFINGLNNSNSSKKIIEFLEKNKCGKAKTSYKLRDWLFSRQRYWGEPFPIIFDGNDIKIENNLPLILPACENFKPSKNGKSPLENIRSWVEIKDGNKILYRETNTMPQWAGSCWYYLGYILKNADGSYTDLNSEEAMKRFKKWLPVDIYIGGQEHAVLHLLYARFWHRFLYDINIVPTKEPFMKIINQGMIQASNGEKMSKSKGNVINPDEIVRSHGADALRLYECFMGPLTASLPWSYDGLDGIRKWLDRVSRLITDHKSKILKAPIKDELSYDYNLMVSKLEKNLDAQQFNVGISNLMVFINACYKAKEIKQEYIEGFLSIFSCYAPHLAEELYASLGYKNSVSLTKFPLFDAKKVKQDKITIAIQINGKLRDTIIVNNGLSKEEVLKIAKSKEKIQKHLENKHIIKEIVILNKIVNIVAK